MDPGLTGAVIAISGGRAFAIDVPVCSRDGNESTKLRINIHAFIAATRILRMFEVVGLTIEDVNGYTGQSASGSFTFGYVAGVMTASLAVIEGLPAPRFVYPTDWQAFFGLKAPRQKRQPGVKRKKAAERRERKERARLRAIELFPVDAALFIPLRGVLPWERAVGRAEAALIAEYGRLMHEQERTFSATGADRTSTDDVSPLISLRKVEAL